MKSCMPATEFLQAFLKRNVPILQQIGGVQTWHGQGEHDQVYEIALKYAIGINTASLNNVDNRLMLSEYSFALSILTHGGMAEFVFQAIYSNPAIGESDEVTLPILCAPEVTQEQYRKIVTSWGLIKKEVAAGVDSLARFQKAIAQIDPIYLGHFFDEGDHKRSDKVFDPLIYLVGAG